MELRPGYKKTEVGVVPADWHVCAVYEKGEVVTGKALAVNAPGVQRPYFRTKNVYDGRIDIVDVLTMPMTEEQFAQFRVRNGDVLLNEGQSLELVGRCAIYQDEYPEPCAIQNALLRFRARPGTNGKFSSYLFRHCQKTGVFARIALQTTSVAHLGGSRFERLRLAWPTEPEQRAIAEALSDIDALLSGLDRLIAKKRDIKQAAMQQLLTGQTRLPGFQGEWETKQLLELADVDPDNLGAGTSPSYSFKYISLENVDYGVLRGFSQEVFETAPSRARRILRRGDVLVSTVRPNLKSHLLFDRSENDWVCSTGFAVVRAKSGQSHPGFLFAHLFAYGVSKQIEALLTGSIYPAINSADVRCLEIPAPAYAEQTAIATVLSDMDAELAALEARRDKTRALKQGMMQELLTGRTRLL
jgi:type I restriction enzyme S subunit